MGLGVDGVGVDGPQVQRPRALQAAALHHDLPQVHQRPVEGGVGLEDLVEAFGCLSQAPAFEGVHGLVEGVAGGAGGTGEEQLLTLLALAHRRVGIELGSRGAQQQVQVRRRRSRELSHPVGAGRIGQGALQVLQPCPGLAQIFRESRGAARGIEDELRRVRPGQRRPQALLVFRAVGKSGPGQVHGGLPVGVQVAAIPGGDLAVPAAGLRPAPGHGHQRRDADGGGYGGSGVYAETHGKPVSQGLVLRHEEASLCATMPRVTLTRWLLVGGMVTLLAACGANNPPPDAMTGSDAEAGTDAAGTDAAGTDSGTDAATSSDAGPPPVPPGCGIAAIDLATLGFDDGSLGAAPVDAGVVMVEPDRLYLNRMDGGGAVTFRFAGPDLNTAFVSGAVVQLERHVDGATGSITDVVSVAGNTVAATVLLFAQTLVQPPSAPSGTGLLWAYNATCNWEDHRDTCGAPPEQVARRELTVTDPVGGSAADLWAADQVLVGTWTAKLVDALALPGYSEPGCTLGAAAYFGLTLLSTP